MAKISVGELVVRCLRAEGVDFMAGIRIDRPERARRPRIFSWGSIVLIRNS